MYGNTASKVVMSVYKDHDWHFWLFDGLPRGYWDVVEHQRKYTDWLGKKLGYTAMEDWYKVKIIDFAHNHGWSVVYGYENTPAKAIANIYPEHDWELWKFDPIPKGFWDNQQNHKKFMDWVTKQLGITDMKDWYYIKHSQLIQYNALPLLGYYNNSVMTAVTEIYTDHQWDMVEFEKAREAMRQAEYPMGSTMPYYKRKLMQDKPLQEDLKSVIRQIFPGDVFNENYHHAKLFSREMASDVNPCLRKDMHTWMPKIPILISETKRFGRRKKRVR